MDVRATWQTGGRFDHTDCQKRAAKVVAWTPDWPFHKPRKSKTSVKVLHHFYSRASLSQELEFEAFCFGSRCRLSPD